MSKVLKRLYLGDVVKSFGTKQLRKLTTEKPQEESIIGTWVFKDTITQLPSDVKYSITFECNGVEYNSLANYWSGNAQLFTYYGTTTKYAYSHKFDEWQGDYQTITITGGVDINNETFANWLKANAVKQESIVGTWVLKQSLTYDDNVPNSSQLPSGDVECEVFVNGVLTKTYIDKLSYTHIGEYSIYLDHYSDNIDGGSWSYGYYKEKANFGSTYKNTLIGGYVYAQNYSGSIDKYFLWDSETGIKLRTLKVLKVSDASNPFWTWLKANATKIA